MATDIIEVLFKAVTQDDGGLARVNDAVKRIASESGLTGKALDNLRANVIRDFEQMSAAGLTFEQQLKRIAGSGDSLGRGVSGSAKLIQRDLNDASDAAAKLAQQQKHYSRLALAFNPP